MSVGAGAGADESDGAGVGEGETGRRGGGAFAPLALAPGAAEVGPRFVLVPADLTAEGAEAAASGGLALSAVLGAEGGGLGLPVGAGTSPSAFPTYAATTGRSWARNA